ncbi:MAG: hypothetical protein KIT25_20410 [Enhydrobacter sp.]|nr:MAG: hypothetical protein KIT25_20410 [Enhydrobacter sp.]
MNAMSLKPFEIPKQAYQNSEQDCDLAFGLYMRGWGQVEMSIGRLFERLSGTDVVTASIIVSAGIDQRTMRDICAALGQQRLDAKSYRQLQKLLERVKSAATTRNRLVHGVWFLELVIDDGTKVANKAEWVRLYMPTDMETMKRIHDKRPDQKLRSRHRFTLDRIAALGAEAHKLGREIMGWSDAAQLLPIRPPQPAF